MDTELLGKFWNSTMERKAMRRKLPDAMAVSCSNVLQAIEAQANMWQHVLDAVS